MPICGKDFKTGQTLIKTVLAPMMKARMLGVEGWFSTNILGNRDGEVLDDPGSFKTKEESKLGVLDYILQPDLYPSLYKDLYHKVRINYYPPRGDNKEGWDNIDLFGWLGYPMQIKVDFLCRDSILAAPLVLDLALFLDLAQRAGMSGIQEWLSFYFKSPQVKPGPVPGARPVHPAHEAQEHAALPHGRGADHPPRRRVLRRRVPAPGPAPGPARGVSDPTPDPTVSAVSLVEAAPLHDTAEQRVAELRGFITSLGIPAEVIHVGSTAHGAGLTKGDVDALVRVDAELFDGAVTRSWPTTWTGPSPTTGRPSSRASPTRAARSRSGSRSCAPARRSTSGCAGSTPSWDGPRSVRPTTA